MLTYHKDNTIITSMNMHKRLCHRLASCTCACLVGVGLIALTGCTPIAPATIAPSSPQNNQSVIESPAALTSETHLDPKSHRNKTMLEQVHAIYQLDSRTVAKEIALLNGQKDMLSKIKLAVLLSRTQQLADTQRALAILDEITQQSQNIERKYYQWVLLLRPLIAEQYQLRSQVAQQAQQLQQNTRKIDDLNNKINALRAIEESLTTR